MEFKFWSSNNASSAKQISGDASLAILPNLEVTSQVFIKSDSHHRDLYLSSWESIIQKKQLRYKNSQCPTLKENPWLSHSRIFMKPHPFPPEKFLLSSIPCPSLNPCFSSSSSSYRSNSWDPHPTQSQNIIRSNLRWSRSICHECRLDQSPPHKSCRNQKLQKRLPLLEHAGWRFWISLGSLSSPEWAWGNPQRPGQGSLSSHTKIIAPDGVIVFCPEFF